MYSPEPLAERIVTAIEAHCTEGTKLNAERAKLLIMECLRQAQQEEGRVLEELDEGVSNLW